MNSEELVLFYFVITSGRNSDNCDMILIEIYKEGRKMPLHERGKVVLYKKFFVNKIIGFPMFFFYVQDVCVPYITSANQK